MFDFMLKLFYIQTTFLSPNIDTVEDHMLTKFITAFDDERNIRNWMENKNIRNLCAFDLFKDIIRKIRGILTIINTEKYINVKSLIMNTNINFLSIGYPYLETFNIIESAKRILWINHEHNTSKFEECNNLELFVKILYVEYEMIYYNIELTIIYISYGCNKCNNTEILNSFRNWIYVDFGCDFELLSVIQNLSPAVEHIKISRCMIKSILPKKYKTPVYVEADYKGFKDSVKCFDDKIHFIIREKPVISICPINMFKTSMECSKDLIIHNKINIKHYMNKTLLCNRIIAKVLITLLHFYSEINRVNTTYEIILNKDNEYQFKWFFSKNLSIKSIKEYWLKQEIPDLSTRKIIHKFGFIINYGVEYSTKKSHYTDDEPIKTRLILLSCGHQLGLQLIDEFFKYFYIKYDKPLNCHICRQTISIVGSYNAVVYRCK